jgi:hypothetical protein
MNNTMIAWLIGIVFIAGGFYFITNYKVGKNCKKIEEHDIAIQDHTIVIAGLTKDVEYIKRGVDDLKETQEQRLQEIKELIQNHRT